jgi:hypothetical protein
MAVKIFIDHRTIRENMRSGGNEPPIVIVRDASTDHVHSVTINGPSKIVYGRERPLTMGVRVWIEAEDAQGE